MLLGEFLGLNYVVEVVAGATDYRLSAGDRTLVIRDHFFGRIAEGSDYATKRNLPEHCGRVNHPFVPGEDVAAIFGSDEFSVDESKVVCGVDLVASTFFMLSRWEESANPARDEHARFPASSSLVFRAGFLLRPVVNEYADLLWDLLQRLGCTQPRKSRTFEIIASHDVDWPEHWTWRTGVVTLAGDLLRRRDLPRATRTLHSLLMSKAGLERDPYDTFDWLMDVSDQSGVKSNFNFMAGCNSRNDPPFPFRPQKLSKLLERVHRRGHGIGFHPSYLTSVDRAMWSDEWRRLSSISPQRVTVGRQHYLRFRAPDTWQLWDDHGMEWDSTLGYADHEGFRCGTCYSYPVFNFKTRRQLRLRELPLIAMDATLVRYRALTVEACRATLRALMEQVRKHQGSFVLLWHNSNLELSDWAAYRGLYRDAIGGFTCP
jgi:hypothetical protein